MSLPVAILVLSVVLLILGVAVTIFIAGKLHQMNKSLGRTIDAVGAMQTMLHTLNTRTAVNEHEHRDISNRIGEQAKQICDQDETIHQLRTSVHMHANELMKMDPAFKPYRRATAGDDQSSVNKERR